MKIASFFTIFLLLNIEGKSQLDKFNFPCNDSIKEVNIKRKLLEHTNFFTLIKMNFVDSFNRKFIALAPSSTIYFVFRDSFSSMEQYIFHMKESLMNENANFITTKNNIGLYSWEVNENEYNLIKYMDVYSFLKKFFTWQGVLKSEYYRNYREIGLYLYEHCILFHGDSMWFIIDELPSSVYKAP